MFNKISKDFLVSFVKVSILKLLYPVFKHKVKHPNHIAHLLVQIAFHITLVFEKKINFQSRWQILLCIHIFFWTYVSFGTNKRWTPLLQWYPFWMYLVHFFQKIVGKFNVYAEIVFFLYKCSRFDQRWFSVVIRFFCDKLRKTLFFCLLSLDCERIWFSVS